MRVRETSIFAMNQIQCFFSSLLDFIIVIGGATGGMNGLYTHTHTHTHTRHGRTRALSEGTRTQAIASLNIVTITIDKIYSETCEVAEQNNTFDPSLSVSFAHFKGTRYLICIRWFNTQCLTLYIIPLNNIFHSDTYMYIDIRITLRKKTRQNLLGFCCG